MNNMKKVENIEKVFIVVRRKAKYVRPEIIWNETFDVKTLAVFQNRKQAEKFLKYWVRGKDIYDILERKLD